MKYILIIFILILSTTPLTAQEAYTDSLGFRYFDMVSNGNVQTMKQYYLVILKTGTNRNHTPDEVTEIQRGHMAHIGWMYEQGYIDMAGPLESGGDYRGILIFNVPTIEKVREITGMDPAVKAGRLAMDIYPWWTARGGTLRP